VLLPKGGIVFMTDMQTRFRRKLIGFGVLLGFFVFVVLCVGVFKAVANVQDTQVTAENVESGSEQMAKTGSTDPGVIKYAFLAAAIAVGIGSLGAGAAVGYVGAAAMGAIGEKPELAGRALIFVGLAEGIAIYGLIIAIMILGKV
jgi:V/A-type H+-transporting ATPase subunit K